MTVQSKEARAKRWYQDRRVLAILLSRVVISGGVAFVMVSSSHLLLKICNGDSSRTQRILSLISTVASIQSLFVNSASGYALDRYGRKPVLVAACFASAFARFLPVLSPSVVAYVSYRLINAAAFVPLTQGLLSMLADLLGGRGSAEFDDKRFLLMALVRMVSLRAAGSLTNPRSNFVAGAILPAIAGLMFLTLTTETGGSSVPPKPTSTGGSDSKAKATRTQDRKGSSLWSRLDPTSFVRFFSVSPQLRAIATLLVLKELSWYCDPLAFRQEKHGWSMKDSETMLQIANICEVVRPVVYPRLAALYGLPTANDRRNDHSSSSASASASSASLPATWKTLSRGLENTTSWDSRIGALCTLNTGLGTRWSAFLNPVLGSLSIGDGPDKALALLSEAQQMGEGETLAAQSNLSFPLSLMLPTVFTEFFARSRDLGFPTLPLLVTAAMQLVTSEVAVPWTWKVLESEESPLVGGKGGGGKG